jgi:ferric-dicitrate binding protein FerR (iron transport regulator)
MIVLIAALWPGTSSRAAPVTVAPRSKATSPLAVVRAIHGGLGVAAPKHGLGKGAIHENLFSNYLLRTAARQLASIAFHDGSVLHLNQKTDATLVSPSSTHIKNGELDEIIRPGSSHKVTTPSATASAIGTNFDTLCKPQICFFFVLEGSVLVTAKVAGGTQPQTVTVIVKTGHYISVVKDQAPSAVTPIAGDPTTN